MTGGAGWSLRLRDMGKGESFMITVTRLNGKQFTVNALWIETVESTPDTLITLTGGKKFNVLESVPEVIALVRNYMASVGMVRSAILGQETEEQDV